MGLAQDLSNCRPIVLLGKRDPIMSPLEGHAESCPSWFSKSIDVINLPKKIESAPLARQSGLQNLDDFIFCKITLGEHLAAMRKAGGQNHSARASRRQFWKREIVPKGMLFQTHYRGLNHSICRSAAVISKCVAADHDQCWIDIRQACRRDRNISAQLPFSGISHGFQSTAGDLGLGFRSLSRIFSGFGDYFGISQAFADESQLPIEKTKLHTADKDQAQGENGDRFGRPLSPAFLLLLVIGGLTGFFGAIAFCKWTLR